ncbi:hypothetical protein CQW23_01733 [Capsicum baccatum]|uniref:Uncharacterized protein n=1 Tax=Capsicum baccatum TaxID=33114 RepID=A0A2G2XPH0_CAPBA|nr:hypothetical protein CQW23_01733 [Capsicum baccatum]
MSFHGQRRHCARPQDYYSIYYIPKPNQQQQHTHHQQEALSRTSIKEKMENKDLATKAEMKAVVARALNHLCAGYVFI